MSNYRFKFQSILNIKYQKEENLKNELGRAIQSLENEKKELQSLNLIKNRHLSEFNENCKKSVVGKIVAHNSYISMLNVQIQNQKESINKAAENVDIVRGNLNDAVKEHKMYTKLNEKKYEAYIQTALREENMLNDESSVYKYYDRNSNDL